MRTDFMELGKFKRLARNPKEHDLEVLYQSIERFGVIDPPVVNGTTGHLIAGHGRIEVLQQKKADGKEPPRNVKVEGEQWLIPTVIVELPESEEEAASIALNKTVELGGWNEARLVEVLSDLAVQGNGALAGVGFDRDDVDALLKMTTLLPFPEYDESVEDEVEYVTCPKCGYKWPK